MSVSKPLATFWFTCWITLSCAASAPLRSARSCATAWSRAVASASIFFCSVLSASTRAFCSARSFLFSWSVIVPIFLLSVLKPSATFWLTCSITLSCALSAPIRSAISLCRAASTLVRFWPIDCFCLIKSLSDVTVWLLEINVILSFKPLATVLALLAAFVASLAACVAAFVASAEAKALASFKVFWIFAISFWLWAILPALVWISAFALSTRLSVSERRFSKFFALSTIVLELFWTAVVNVSLILPWLAKESVIFFWRLLTSFWRAAASLSILSCSFVSAAARASASALSAAARACCSARSFLFSWSVIVPMFLLIVSTELTRLSLTCLMTLSCAASAPLRSARSWATALSRAVASSEIAFVLASTLLCNFVSAAVRAVVSSVIAFALASTLLCNFVSAAVRAVASSVIAFALASTLLCNFVSAAVRAVASSVIAFALASTLLCNFVSAAVRAVVSSEIAFLLASISLE